MVAGTVEPDHYVVPSQGYRTMIGKPDKTIVCYYKVPRVLHRKQRGVGDIPYCILATGLEKGVEWRNYEPLNRWLNGKLFVMVANRQPSGFSGVLKTMECCDYETMLDRLGLFHRAWAGHNDPYNECHWDDIVTNKFWDYLAAGIPANHIVCYQCNEMIALCDRVYRKSEDIFGETEAEKLVKLY